MSCAFHTFGTIPKTWNTRPPPPHHHHHVVITYYFDGSETFDEAIKKFQRAKIVVGPHGAAMTNLLFSKDGTQVIEYLIPWLIGRPDLFMCATTIGMEWWPVLLSSFQAESEILRSVAVIKEAANRQMNNSIIHQK